MEQGKQRKLGIIKRLLLIASSIAVFLNGAMAEDFKDPLSNQTTAATFSMSELDLDRGSTVAAFSVDSDARLKSKVLSAASAKFGLDQTTSAIQFAETKVDELGARHYRGVQTIESVPVVGARFDIHLNTDKDSIFVNAKVSHGRPESMQPQIDGDRATELAESHWKDSLDSQPETARAPTLVVFDSSVMDRFVSGKPRLAYQIDLGSRFEAYRYFVDAITGDVLKRLSLDRHLNREVGDCSYGDGECYFGAYSSKYDYTFGRVEGDDPVGKNPIDDPELQAYPYDTDNVYELVKAYAGYLQARFKRNGPNGKGGLGGGQVYAPTTTAAMTYIGQSGFSRCPNAFYSSYVEGVNFCAGMANVDTIFHELTHGLTHFTSDLIYQNESGALNESFSDILAEAAENFLFGENDWLCGSSRVDESLTGIARSMKNPEEALWNPYLGDYSNGMQPSHFYSSKVYCGEQDNGGVHQNSGVLNHAAYLIAEGGSFNGCSIPALGMKKMEQIMYRALTKYLTPTSTFYDAYVAIRQSAWELVTAEEFLSVEKALLAVQLNQPGKCSGIKASPTQCSAWIDQCPDHPDLIREGACGCGVPEVDANNNGVPDCIDINGDTRPAAPVVSKLATKKRKKVRKFLVALQEVPGAQYIIRFNQKGKRPIYRRMKTPLIRVTLKGKGAWRISYRIRVNGQLSKFSREMRLR